MATQVKIKRRTADAAAPTGLTAGEMAINLVDKKLYVGGTAGTNTIFLDSTAVAVLGTANTFTQLNSFSAGISASGATFTGSISGATATFSKDITVNSITVGLGKSSDTNNVAIGHVALASNTSDYDKEGTGNVAIGSSALTSNTTGSSNVGVGPQALYSNTTGDDNVGVGQSALYFNTTGNYNVGVGGSALNDNTTGSNNVGVGDGALNDNTTGSNKTAIGYAAGRYRGSGVSTLTTGTGGIYIGYQARGSADTQTNEIVIGVDALGLGSNTAVIGATLQSAATIYGVLNLPSGLSAAGATFAGTVNYQDNTLSRVELLDYFERYSDLGDFTTASTQIPIDLSTAQVFRTKLTVTCTGLTLANVPDNGNANAVGFSLLFVGDGTARTMTWNIGNTAASWAGGTAPTYTSTNNKTDVFSFLSRDGGSTWLGFVGGQNF